MGHDVTDALEKVRVPSYIVDRHGIIRWVNPAAVEIVGDVRGRQFTSVLSPEEARRRGRSSHAISPGLSSVPTTKSSS
jgi:hypothetical protein